MKVTAGIDVDSFLEINYITCIHFYATKQNNPFFIFELFKCIDGFKSINCCSLIFLFVLTKGL